ncbi:MAG TPA: hypothetical protein VN661_09385 [Candidatus Acidoferrales bacterium]|nr:hypothetical protein [Candidatus Acidoferrales bacterium]
MDYKLKSISKSGIAEAAAKAELYRYLNEPEEAESICRDILAIDPGQQLALRLLGLAVTDQFVGSPADRYRDAESAFAQLTDPYERFYYTGLLLERRAKAQLHAGQPPHTLVPLIERALESFGEAEKIRPAGNDDSILRWNRCVRLLQTPGYNWEEDFELLDALQSHEAHDAPPAWPATARRPNLASKKLH